MLKHYIKFAFRSFRANKVIFIGSLLTLCLGVLCSSLLITYVFNEITMDDFHKHKERIYIEAFESSPESEWQSPPPAINIDYGIFPEIDAVVTIRRLKKEYKQAIIYNNNESYYPDGVIVDSTFFNILDFKLKTGSKETIFNDPFNVILSETFSKRLFGDESPIGKTLKIKTSFEHIYTVRGIIQVPSNSSMTFDFLLPHPKNSEIEHGIGGNKLILVNKAFNKNKFLKKVEAIDIIKLYKTHLRSSINYQPLHELYYQDTHLRTNILSRYGNKNHLKIMLVIILVIVIISALNYSNLEIINVNNSVKYNAITLINGGGKSNIIKQKITYSLLLFGFVLIGIMVLYRLILPYFNILVNIELQPARLTIFLIICCSLVFIMLLALIYPLLIIYKSVASAGVKNVLVVSNNLITRKTILVFQYTLTVVFLICSLIVTKQLQLMLNKDLGFVNKNIVRVKLHHSTNELDNGAFQKLTYIKNELNSNPNVVSFSQGHSPLTLIGLDLKSKNSTIDFREINFISGDSKFKEIFGLTLLEGRWFNKKNNTSLHNKKVAIINESAKKLWQIDNINSDKILTLNEGFKGYDIIGVIKDFNNEHLSSKPKPLIIFPAIQPDDDFFIKLEKERAKEGLMSLEKLFRDINPNKTFSYVFLSDEIAALYTKEKQLSIIYILFTIVALIISGIGLFTIALYDIQKRVKEIGIRKVNGATINEIMLMLNKDFIKWVVIAFVIACPIAYYAMSKWLENFAYKTSLSWWVFVLAGIFTLVIALITVSWQTYRAATRNPVESLRDE